jgi:hypothetical protein
VRLDRERLASWGKGLLVVILIAQLLGLLIIFRGEGEETDPGQTAQAPPAPDESPSPTQSASPTPEEESDDSAVAQEDTSQQAFTGTTHVNSQGGYRFRYPLGWEAEHSGTATEVTSSDEKVKVSFGLAPAGDVRSASEKTTAVIQDEYEDVIVTELGAISLGGRPAGLVQGKATNSDGVRLLFRSVTVGGKNEVFAILAFEAADSEEEMRSEIGEIIETFRQTRSGARSVSAAPTPTGSMYSVSAS